MTPSSDDLSLLAAYASSRNPEAFAELARRYAGLVLSVSQRITRSAHDAEDITQTCFLELAKNAHAVKSIPGYLHRAATTRSLNLLRDNKTRRARESQSPLRAPDLTWQELLPLVDEAINRLPDDLRIPLILHYQQSQSQPEIATNLHLSQSTVSRRLDAAIHQLRKTLGEMGEGTGAVGGGVTGALSAATATVALLHIAAPTPPVTLLTSLNKIGLAGVSAAGTTTAAGAPLTKIIALILLTTTFALTLIYLFPRNNSPQKPPTSISVAPAAAPKSPAETPNSDSAQALENTVAASTHVPTLTSTATWQSTYPNPIAALSPDGALILVASSANASDTNTPTSLTLLTAATHEPLQNFPAHSRFITAVAFSPDGTLLASASRDGTLRLFDPLTADNIGGGPHTLQIPHAWITAFAFTPDSKKILLAAAFNMDTNPASPHSSLYVYDLATEKLETPFPPFDTAAITALAISPDNKLLALATTTSDTTLYDLSTSKPLYTLPQTQSAPTLLFTDPDHLLISHAPTLTLWNLPDQSPQTTFPLTPTSLSLDTSTTTLLTTTPNSTLTLNHFAK